MSLEKLVTRVAVLLNAIGHVLALRSEKQMSRVAARRIVAAVANVEAAMDGSVHKLEGESMRPHNGMRSRVEVAIALPHSASDPRPAASRAARPIDLRPEPLLDRFGFPSRHHMIVHRARDWRNTLIGS